MKVKLLTSIVLGGGISYSIREIADLEEDFANELVGKGFAIKVENAEELEEVKEDKPEVEVKKETPKKTKKKKED